MATTISPKRKRRNKSVLKRIRQTEHRAAVNRANRSRLRTQVKKFRQAVATGDVAQARELLHSTLSSIDRSLHKGVLHPNTAARTKSRLVRRFHLLAQPQKASAQPAAN